MKSTPFILLTLLLIVGCAALPKAQAPAPAPANVNERLAAIDAALPDATKKVEATPAWSDYKAAAAVAEEKLKAVKALPEFKAYQRLVTEQTYLKQYVGPKR